MDIKKAFNYFSPIYCNYAAECILGHLSRYGHQIFDENNMKFDL